MHKMQKNSKRTKTKLMVTKNNDGEWFLCQIIKRSRK
jgi:hypothetical protein